MPAVRDIRYAPISAAATGDAVAAITNGKIVVIGYALVNNVATAQNITFRSATGTNLTGSIALPSSIGGGVVYAGGYDCPAFETNFGEGLNLLFGAATAIAGHITYYVVRR